MHGVDDRFEQCQALRGRRTPAPMTTQPYLHLSEHGAVRVHGVGLLRERISPGAAASLDLGQAGAG